ncbi:MAG: hypothetical protein HY207_13935 [Nitrospirae bacterium]|nr:hypothetical protein [Nitrospirota bacterium]
MSGNAGARRGLRGASASAAAWVGLVAVLITGCGAHRPAVSDEALPRRDATLDELERLFAERGRGESYRALVTLAVQSGSRAASVRGTVTFTEPRTFVVRGMDLLGRDLFELSADGEDLKLARPDQAAPVVGAEAIEAGLAPWLGSLSLTDVLRVLGASHGVRIDPFDVVVLERGEDRYVLYFLVLDEGRARLDRKVSLERTRFLPVSEEWFDAQGSGRIRVRFDRYARVGEGWRPLSVTASSGAGTLHIEFQEIVVAAR